jgi:hypothetical protein
MSEPEPEPKRDLHWYQKTKYFGDIKYEGEITAEDARKIDGHVMGNLPPELRDKYVRAMQEALAGCAGPQGRLPMSGERH